MDAARVRRQRVQTRARTTWLPTRIFPTCRLGRKRRFVRLLEWLTLCPYCGPLPQISHLFAMIFPCSGCGTRPDCTIGPAHEPQRCGEGVDAHGSASVGTGTWPD